MQLTLIQEGNYYGIKSSEKFLLHPKYDDITLYHFKKDQLIEEINLKCSGKSIIARIREKFENSRSLVDINSSEGVINVSHDSEVIFLLKDRYETFLMKFGINLYNQRMGIYQLYNEFATLENFKLNKKYRKFRMEDSQDIVTIGNFYDEIVYLGGSFFKVKVVEVYKILEPIDEDGTITWKTNFDNSYWQIVNLDGDKISKARFEEVISFSDGLFNVLHNGNESQLRIDGSYVKS